MSRTCDLCLTFSSFLGALIKKRDFVSAYGSGLILYLTLSICSGAFALYALFHQNEQDAISQCLNGAQDQLTWKACKNGVAVAKGLAVAIYVVIWLLIICESMATDSIAKETSLATLDAYIIVSNYVEQLDDEMAVQETKQMIDAISLPAPITTYTSFGPNTLAPGHAFRSANQSYRVRENMA